ncbi:DUF397 domain-containing protein [Actinosynnema sp. NPDC047251]|uniref:DUF397 domain-containing protein n=1 Tax=Saccharothrix espanaensis (strain ATCC 51144 / DSM 44229 / JCM 9112 / NBRC 15066 / NRRL 15764) TaxID=1179773 RepID=K0K930_SACES|nr:DUF397 domain-containing protein [Saccharothrix espanaensis]CCH34047.1 hypothetical protein BN6_68100 [Saccharothrix espanaensis DSM 44229]
MPQQWRKSRRSSASGPDCVEIALIRSGAAVRDSKNRSGGALDFGATQWGRFLGHAKAGAYDER